MALELVELRGIHTIIYRRDHYGYHGRAVLTQELSAVTAACLVVLKKAYLEVGGLMRG